MFEMVAAVLGGIWAIGWLVFIVLTFGAIVLDQFKFAKAERECERDRQRWMESRTD